MEHINTLKDSERRIEACLFAAKEPYSIERLKEIVHPDCDVFEVIASLERFYENSYIRLTQINGTIKFEVDLGFIVADSSNEDGRVRKIDGSSLTALAVIAFHQPITFSEINEFLPEPITRKVIDRLMGLGLVAPNARKDGTGRAITYVTTQDFLDGFGLSDISDLMDPEEVVASFKKVNAPQPTELNRE